MPAADPTDVAPLLAAMTDAGYAGQATMLAIPSAWCMSAFVVLASRRLARNRQAVAYALEERLPLSAEDMVYDVLTHDTYALGVAVEAAAMVPVVGALEQAGIQVATVVPTAMVLLPRLLQLRRLPHSGVVLLAAGDGCDFLVLSGRRLQQWRWLPLESDALVRETAAFVLAQCDEEAVPVTAINVPDGLAAALGELGDDIELTCEACALDEMLVATAADVLTRGTRPWIELRRGQLGQYDPYRLMRGALRAMLATLLLTIVCLTAVGWIRGDMYKELTGCCDSQKIDIFRQLFPEARVPTGIRSRLESEHRTLLGMSAGEMDAPALRAVTGSLVDMLHALPPELRFRLMEVRCEASTAYLEGEVRRHGDVDEIAASLRAQGFTVEPPRTEQLAGEGVGFTLSLSFLPPPDGSR